MNTSKSSVAMVGLATGLLLSASYIRGVYAGNPHEKAPTSAAVSVFATGLNNPRGLKFGPDGYLYVAEGGVGGLNSTAGQCEQVVPPVGPYTGSPIGGRISKIDSNGLRATVVDNLPSSQTSPSLGSLVSGVADVSFIGDPLYALLAGAGCSHGVLDLPNGIIRVNTDGTWSLIADLGAFQKANPVENPEPDDFEPDGTWYSMVAVRGDLYAVEPNHGELDRITPDGQVSRVVDISASEGHIVPTSVAVKEKAEKPQKKEKKDKAEKKAKTAEAKKAANHGNFYVGNLNTFPIEEGSSKIYKITPSGQIKIVVEGLTTVLGVAFDARGRMYALENTTGNPFPTPGTGRVLRVQRSGALEVIASGLDLPTAMTFGPDGNLYVSNWGFGPPIGQVLKIELAD